MSVLVVIVNYRVAPFALQCLRSLIPERERNPDLRVTVIENDSGDEAALREGLADPAFEGWTELVVAERNGGFAYGNNYAVRRMLSGPEPADYVLLLNPDTEVLPGAIETLVAFMESHPDAGIAGAGLINGDGSDWPVAFRFPTILSELDQGMRFGPVARLLKKYVVRTADGPRRSAYRLGPGRRHDRSPGSFRGRRADGSELLSLLRGDGLLSRGQASGLVVLVRARSTGSARRRPKHGRHGPG